MPNFVGDSYDDAYAALVDWNVQVIREDTVVPDEEGTVVQQEPEAGEPFRNRVTLTVASAPPRVPDVVGETVGTAERDLEELGFTVREEPTFDERQRDGLVVSQDPPPGTTNAGEVVLGVTRRPVIAYLADMPLVSESPDEFETGSFETNGEVYPHSVMLGINPYSGKNQTSAEYNLSRDYRQLLGAVGLTDDASGDARYQVELLADGRQVWAESLALGEIKEVDADVTDVLRLRVVVTQLEGTADVVLADLRTLGLQEEVEATPTASPSSS